MAPAPSLMVTYAPATYMRGPTKHPIGDGVAHGNVAERTIHADIPHRREAGSSVRRAFGMAAYAVSTAVSLDDLQRLGRSEIGQMRVTVDEPREAPSSMTDRSPRTVGTLTLGPTASII